MRLLSLASLSGLRIWRCPELWRRLAAIAPVGPLDPALLWLWRRLAAIAPVGPLAWEPPYTAGGAPKKQKKKIIIIIIIKISEEMEFQRRQVSCPRSHSLLIGRVKNQNQVCLGNWNLFSLKAFQTRKTPVRIVPL